MRMTAKVKVATTWLCFQTGVGRKPDFEPVEQLGLFIIAPLKKSSLTLFPDADVLVYQGGTDARSNEGCNVYTRVRGVKNKARY